MAADRLAVEKEGRNRLTEHPGGLAVVSGFTLIDLRTLGMERRDDFLARCGDRLEGKSAAEVARTFIGLWRMQLVKSDFRVGCAGVAITVAADSPVLLESVAEVFRNWRHRLSALLAEGGVPANRALAMSATLIGACEGAVVLSRAERSIEPFDLVAVEQLAAIEAATKKG
jgi:hypothetical protein